MSRIFSRAAIVAAVLCMTAFAAWAGQTTSSMKEDKAFQVIAVDGSTLVVRLPEGTRELTVGDDFRFTIDGQQMSVHQLKPGMKGTATITTTTTVTPVTVTEVKNGTVMQSSANSILVRTDQGFKNFTESDVDKRGVEMTKDGRPAKFTDFHQGDTLTATIITQMPPKVLTQKQVQATLAKAAPGGAAAATTGPSGSASTKKASASSAASAGKAPASSGTLASNSTSSMGSTHSGSGSGKTLPKTASSWPLLGLVSFLSVAMGLVLTLSRRVVR
jgi:hypothetical protein